MIVKELIDKLKEYSGDLFVIIQTHHGECDYDFPFPDYSIVTDVYIEEDCCVMLSDSKYFRHKASVIDTMIVKEVINELSKYSPDLEVNTQVFDFQDYWSHGWVCSTIGDIAKVSCNESGNMVILSGTE